MGKLFGTFGIRRIANEVFTPEMVNRLILSFGTFIEGDTVVVGRDPRKSSEMLYHSVIAGLMSCGCKVIEIGITATPTLQWACRQWSHWGAMVTASHNPPEWNGLKLMEKSGKGLDPEQEAVVEELYFKENFRRVAWSSIPQGTVKRPVNQDYIEAIVSKVNAEEIRSRSYRVIIDCANGSPSLITPLLLSELGCRVVSLNAHPDGRFPGRNPEPTPQNLTDLTTLMKHGDFDVGFAQDGDGDRLIIVRDGGIFVSGDYSVSLVADTLAKRMGPGPIVTTVATTHLLKEIAHKTGRRFITTAVGDRLVAKALQETDGIFGCEENGGMIFPDFVWGRDGAIAAAWILDIMATSGKSLKEILAELPSYHQVKKKVSVEPGKKEDIIRKIDSVTASYPDRITLDGFKVVFDDDSWILVRPSGTEPLFRVFSESRDLAHAEKLVEEYLHIINSV